MRLKLVFDFALLFAGIFAGKGIIYLGYNVESALTIAATVPIVLGSLRSLVPGQ